MRFSEMTTTPAIEKFEHIIRHESTQELIPFLLALEKKDVTAVRDKLKSLKKELESIVQKSSNSWGSNGTSEQFDCLFLAGFATFSRREALSNLNSGWAIGASTRGNSAALIDKFLVILKAIRPEWLSDWLQNSHVRASGWAINYELLRTLEDEQLVPYSPDIAGRAVAYALQTWGGELSDVIPVPLNAAKIIADKFRMDSRLLLRDLPLLFDYDNGIDAVHGARIQPALPLNEKGFKDAGGGYHYPWQVWNKKHPPQFVTWQEVLLALTSSGHLNRADILTRCLLALRRDFRRPLLTWFKELFLALQPTPPERLARQGELVELLAHPVAYVANFAIEQLKDLLPKPEFALAPVLVYADNLVTRPDLKTGLRTLLTGLGKLPGHKAAHTPAVARLLAVALAHPDGAVQERAAKGLAGILQATKPLLTAAEVEAAVAAIGGHAELLATPARTALATWLAPLASA